MVWGWNPGLGQQYNLNELAQPCPAGIRKTQQPMSLTGSIWSTWHHHQWDHVWGWRYLTLPPQLKSVQCNIVSKSLPHECLLQFTPPPPIITPYLEDEVIILPNRTGKLFSTSPLMDQLGTLSIPRHIGMARVDFRLETCSSIVLGLMHGLLLVCRTQAWSENELKFATDSLSWCDG